MADPLFTPVTPASVPCKCCGSQAPLFGVTDFNRSCRDGKGLVLPLAGIPVYYHRCLRCGFLFTTHFDGFSKADFIRLIYNEEYVKIDPNYEEQRPANWATGMASFWGQYKHLRILDYGGGSGILEQRLREMGFANVVTFDPFVPKFSARPAGQYDLLICAEVVEHSPTPRETFADIAGFMADTSAVVIGTMFQPHDIQQQGMNWWYLGPRNGHVSLYSWAAMQHLAQAVGCLLTSVNPGTHILRRGQPAWANSLLNKT